MAYVKPQTPLNIGEDKIYPLTTEDQVILKDGTRLDTIKLVKDKLDTSTFNSYKQSTDNSLSSISNNIVDLQNKDTEIKNKIDGLITDDEVKLDKTWSSQKIANRLNDIELAKFPNVTIVGSPTIQQGQISNFTANNYCQFPFIVDFKNQPFELDFEITTGNEVNNQHNVFDSVFGLAFAVRNGKFVLAVSTNGVNWNIGEVLGTHTVLTNTTYRIKLAWDKANLTLAYSIDGGESYVVDSTRELTEQPYPKQILIGVTTDKSTIFNGSINLNYASLTIANKLVWQGMDDVGLQTRMAVDMSNIDEAGVNKVKEIAETENKVDKIEGKSLSTNDFTNFYKDKLDGLQNYDDTKVKEDIDLLQKEDVKIYDEIKALIRSSFDGTKKKYDMLMKDWLMNRGILAMTPQGITSLLDEWYEFTRVGWSGGVQFAQPHITAVSEGVKIGDNANLICEPSTDTVKGRDDYEGLPLFAVKDVNWVLDDTGDILITAIDGIHSNFERSNPNIYVGVIQQAPFHWWDEKEEYYCDGLSDFMDNSHDICEPTPEAIRPNGTFRNFVVHGKYPAKYLNSKLTCCAGVIPTAWMSENNLIDRAKGNGVRYSGFTSVDLAWLHIHSRIKYASLTMDNIIQGCVNNNYQRYAIVSESNTNRVLIGSNRISEFEIGEGVLIGAYGGSADRNNSGVYSISGQAGRIVTSVELVEINGTQYTAITVDGASFNTVASPTDTTATNGSTIISSFHWTTGTNDAILGNDGSIKNPKNGKYPSKLQGIEYSLGAYEVLADTIQTQTNEHYTVYVCKDVTKQSKSSVANYIDSGIKCPKVASGDAWQYIKKLAYAKGIYYPTLVGGSSSTFTRDGFYMNGANTTSGNREFLPFGLLSYGSGAGGLSCLLGSYALSHAHWTFASRLSCNGTRGEFA